MYSASAVESANVDWSLLYHTTSNPHIMPRNHVLERMLSPFAKDKYCHIIACGEMFPLNVRQEVLVPLRYLRIRFA
jgi:hypothetical protein